MDLHFQYPKSNFLLGNTPGAGSLVCVLWFKMQTELWVRAQRDKSLWAANPLHNKGCKDYWPGRWTITERHSRSWRLEKSKTSPHVDCEGVSLLGILLRGTSSSCFFYYSAMNKLLYGYLRLCYGKPVVELVRTPGLTAWLGCVKHSTHCLTATTSCEGVSVLAVKASGTGNVTDKVPAMVRLGCFLNTIRTARSWMAIDFQEGRGFTNKSWWAFSLSR